ncbi:MAG: hypothetical protein AAF939_14660 [Planctomycetota bacterium]
MVQTDAYIIDHALQPFEDCWDVIPLNMVFRIAKYKFGFTGNFDDLVSQLRKRPREFEVLQLFDSNSNKIEWFVWDNRHRHRKLIAARNSPSTTNSAMVNPATLPAGGNSTQITRT